MRSRTSPAAAAVGDARIPVLVTPRASKDSIELLDAGEVRVRVTAPPADGAANQAVLRVLAKALGVGAGRLRILSGTAGRRKVVQVRDMPPDELGARLAGIGAQASVASRRRTAGRIPPAR